MQYGFTTFARRGAAILAVMGAVACDSTRTSEPMATPQTVPAPAGALSSVSISGEIVIDDFNSGGGTFNAGWTGHLKHTLSDVIGGAREHGWYNHPFTTVDAAAGTLTWGAGTYPSPIHHTAYGTAIGRAVYGSSPNTGSPLNLALTLQDEVVVDIVGTTSWATDFRIYLLGGNGGWYLYHTSLPSTAIGELRVKLSDFKAEWNNSAMTAAAAADIDGIRFYGIYHQATKFAKFSIRRASPTNLFTSGSDVQTWDPIYPAEAYANWETTVCTPQPLVGPDANWENPHNAFVLGGHPWAGSYFTAPWINAWNNLASQGPEGHNWTKYRTQVSGNGTFAVSLLADNCSWIYLDGALVGRQPANHNASNTQYGLTLNGNHTLEFIIFDGGGSAGGKFRLEATTTPPPPLDADGPVIEPTLTGTVGQNDWYTSDVGLSWSVTDPQSAISSRTGCDASSITADTQGQTFTCTATSAGGTSTRSVTIKRDATAPTASASVSGTLGNAGWYVDDVTVGFTTADAMSGVASSTGCGTTVLSTDTNGVTYTCMVTDVAGNTGSAATSVKRDATKPAIGFTPSSASYTVDQTVSIACAASDALSGLASNTCANVTGAAYTFDIGANTRSATATDIAGNSNGASASFTVSVTNASLCALVNRWVSNAGVANSMCVKLKNSSYRAFSHEVEAQSGKKFLSEANASILLRLVQELE